MKVFVTGGTGYIGSAVSLRLKKAGHDVQALVRNKEKASALQTAGVKLVQGDLGNPAGYSAAAYGAQAIVHCASDSGPQSVELDRKSIQNARELLHGRVGATFIYTSGIWVLGDTAGAVVDESRPTDPAKIVAWRPAHEQLALEQKVSSEKARTELEWRPRHEDFVAEAPQLFAQWQSAQ